MADSEATSPAKTGDATQNTGSDGLTLGQAAARLFASAEKAAAQQLPETAAVETTTEQSAPPETKAAAEAEVASVETDPEAPITTEETTAENETGGEGDEVLSPTTLDDKLKAKIQKRIDKEVGKRKVLEARLAEMEAKLNTQTPSPDQQTQAQATTPIVLGNQALAHVQDTGTLHQLEKQAKDAIRWAEQTLDTPKSWKTSTQVDPVTGEESVVKTTMIGDKAYDEAAIKAIMRTARVTLEDEIPERRQFLVQRDQMRDWARKEHPFLNDKSSPEYQQAQAMLRDPWIQMRPDAEWIVATQIEGIKALEAKKVAAKKTAEQPPKPKAPVQKPAGDQTAVSATTAATRVSADAGQRLAMKAEREKLMAKGGVTAAEAAGFLERNQRTRNSR